MINFFHFDFENLFLFILRYSTADTAKYIEHRVRVKDDLLMAKLDIMHHCQCDMTRQPLTRRLLRIFHLLVLEPRSRETQHQYQHCNIGREDSDGFEFRIPHIFFFFFLEEEKKTLHYGNDNAIRKRDDQRRRPPLPL